jgi:hypothetical protein
MAASSLSWPTQVGADDQTLSSVQLMESGERTLIRQGLFQVQSAKMLMERGHDVVAVQQPLIGQRVRITIPILIKRTGPDLCVYTECEPWTADRIAALQAWLRDLRAEGPAEVMVVSRESSDTVARLPEVKEFIRMADDDLPPSA